MVICVQESKTKLYRFSFSSQNTIITSCFRILIPDAADNTQFRIYAQKPGPRTFPNPSSRRETPVLAGSTIQYYRLLLYPCPADSGKIPVSVHRIRKADCPPGQKLPWAAIPGTGVRLSRVPVLYSRSLLVVHFK